MFTAIDRYVVRQILGPLGMTLVIAALLLVLERMLRLFNFVVNEGGPVDVVFRMLANLTPHYIGLALPIGLFLGVLIAFRRLSLSSELDAIMNAGYSLSRLMRPILALAVFLLMIDFILTGWIQPISRYTYRSLVFDLRSGALGASIRVGDFVPIGDDMVLHIDSSKAQGSALHGIFLERTTTAKRISISADRGGFFATNDDQTILLRLYDGILIDLNEQQNKPRVLSFEQQDLSLRLPSSDAFRERGGEEREMTIAELYQAINQPVAATEQSEPTKGKKSLSLYSNQKTRAPFQAAQGQFHWRVAHSLAFLILPFLAVPMGLTSKRRGQSTGLVVGLGLLIVYNEVMEAMEAVVAKGHSPYLSLWLVFSLFAMMSLLFFRTSAYRVGGDPLRLFDLLWQHIKSPILAFLRKIGALAPS